MVDLDEEALGAARAELGTTTIKDTVNEALRRASEQRGPRVVIALDTLAAGRPGRRVALTHLVDTSALTRLGNADVRAAIEELATAGSVARPTICDLEIGYSARNAAEWDRLIEALGTFVLIETSAAHVRRALQVQRLLAQRSQRVARSRICSSQRQLRNATSRSCTTTLTSTSSHP